MEPTPTEPSTAGSDAQDRIDELTAERDRLRAVVRKVVAEAAVAVDGDTLTFADGEYSGPNPFDLAELAAYLRATDG